MKQIEIIGTPKQVAWAEDIRKAALVEIEKDIDMAVKGVERGSRFFTAKMVEDRKTARDFVFEHFTKAEWWIREYKLHSITATYKVAISYIEKGIDPAEYVI